MHLESGHPDGQMIEASGNMPSDCGVEVPGLNPTVGSLCICHKNYHDMQPCAWAAHLY